MAAADDLLLESPTSGALPAALAPGVPQPVAGYHAPAPAAPMALPQPAAPAYHAPPAPVAAPPPVRAVPTRAEWTAGCNRIIDNIVKNLGPEAAPIFYEPVNPVQAGATCTPSRCWAAMLHDYGPARCLAV